MSRWQHYIMHRGPECLRFWRRHLSDDSRRVLLILGLGFDPRMCCGLRMLSSVRTGCVRECSLLKYSEGPHSPSQKYAALVKDNLQEVTSLMAGHGCITEGNLGLLAAAAAQSRPRRASDVISQELTHRFTDIVVDISALPRSIYFPILAKLLTLLDVMEARTPVVNLHVLVAEDVSVDERIREEGVDERAAYIQGFSADLELQSAATVPRVWIPALGEGQEEQLRRIYDHVHPDEICPVLPSPSVNPRRADDLIAEYRELLFDLFRVEPTNFIYACEWNPFEVYRQVYGATTRYNSALEALGRCKVVVSALSSKLLSVGALLAAYEAKRKNYMIGIAHVGTQGYTVDLPVDASKAELFSLWVAGECYNA